MPLPIGSVPFWANSLLQAWVFALSAVMLVLLANGRIRQTSALYAARYLFGILGAWLLWLLLQRMPLPREYLASLSSGAGDFLALTQPLATAPETAHLSLYPFATTTAILNTFAYALFLALALQLINSSRRIRTLLWVIIACGIFQAVYGGLAALSHSTVATGTFVNRNHLGGYLEMCLAVGIGLLLSETGDIQMVSWRHRLFTVLRWLSGPKFRLRLGLALMVVTLVLTRSRGANTAFFVSLILAGAVWLYITRKRPSIAAMLMLASIFVIDIIILGEWFGLDKVVQRIQETSAATEMRDDVWLETSRIWSDFPVTGTGAGSFVSIFASYRDAASAGANVFLRHAHNDYLEFLIETGPVGLLLLASVALLALRQAWLAMSTRHRPLLQGLGFGSLMGIIAILYHSIADFNLRIPSNAMMFMLLIGLAYIGAHYRSPRPEPRRPVIPASDGREDDTGDRTASAGSGVSRSARDR